VETDGVVTIGANVYTGVAGIGFVTTGVEIGLEYEGMIGDAGFACC
jgi:hypothetical protein